MYELEDITKMTHTQLIEYCLKLMNHTGFLGRQSYLEYQDMKMTTIVNWVIRWQKHQDSYRKG